MRFLVYEGTRVSFFLFFYTNYLKENTFFPQEINVSPTAYQVDKYLSLSADKMPSK